MANREELQHRSPRDVPPVGRPRGAVWRSLQADGVVWEGQVQLVGDGLDLAARMIVTHRRVVFVRGGELALDIPRGWLRPEPVLRRDGVLDLFISMPGSDLFDEPMKVPLRMREGHPAAGHIIAMLAPGGVRRIQPDALSGMDRAREISSTPRFGSFWDDDHEPLFERNGLVATAGDGDESPAPPSNGTSTPSWTPLEPPDRVVRASSAPQRRPVTNGFPITGLQPRDQRKSPWGLVLRLGALTALLATAAALGAGKLEFGTPGGNGTGAVLTAPTPTVAAVGSPAAPETALAPEEESAIAIGVGGAAGGTTADEPAAPQADETTPAAPATDAVLIPTPAPTTEPEPEPESEPEATATPMPAAEPATAASPAPATESVTANAATPNSAALTQPAAVTANAPAQEIVVGPLRVAIVNATRAESLPRYGLPPGSGEWVLLIANVSNDGDGPVTLPMSDFRLFDRGTGTTAAIDSGTDVIAELAGFDPVRSADDVISLDAGQSTETLLLYLLPPGSSEDVAVLVGERSLELAPALTLGETAAAAAPELVQAKVAEVVDGSRIVVDISGQRETVQYLGMQAPTGDTCFAAEAAAANTELLQGQDVWLERQASDRGADNALLRDVWIADANGGRAHVAARLLEAGAGTAAPTAPDTRYEAWLQASSALAQSNRAGLWSACG